MSDTEKIIEIVDALTTIAALSLAIIQQVSGKSDEDVMKSIQEQGTKTDELLKKLR